MSSAETFFFRWRVRLGYPLAIVVLWFARPSAQSVTLGALVGAIGLWLRAYAAGYLHKQEFLRNRAIRVHAQSALSRQRHSCHWRSACHALVDLRSRPLRVFRAFLFLRDAPRGARTALPPRRRFRAICQLRALVFSSVDSGEAGRTILRRLLPRAVQKES